MFPTSHYAPYPSAYSTPLRPYSHYDDLLLEDARRREHSRELALLEALRLEEHGRYNPLDDYYRPALNSDLTPDPFSVAHYRQLAHQRAEAEARVRAAQAAREREEALLLLQAEKQARLERARALERERLVEEAQRQLQARLQIRERVRRAQELARVAELKRAQEAQLARERAERERKLAELIKVHMVSNYLLLIDSVESNDVL
jgi:hypothetical protein